jgi:multidrug resistance efflux pump
MKIRFDPPERRTPDNDRGVRIEYGAARRGGTPWRWYLILIVASIPLLYLMGAILREFLVVEADGRITMPQIVVRSSGDGYIQKIVVQPLETVAEGAELALLANEPLENRHNRVRGEIDFLEAERDKLLQPASSALGSAQLLAFAEQQRDFYQRRLHQYEALFKQGAATQAEVSTARSQYTATLERLAALGQSLGVASEVRQMGARVSQLKLELNEIEDRRQQLLLTAPTAGMVAELFVQPGEYLDRGRALLEIVDPGKAHVTAHIPPKYLDYAVIGQTATVAFPNGESAEARIVSVPGVIQRTPPDDLAPLEKPLPAILAQMEFVSEVKSRLVHGAPSSVSITPGNPSRRPCGRIGQSALAHGGALRTRLLPRHPYFDWHDPERAETVTRPLLWRPFRGLPRQRIAAVGRCVVHHQRHQ